MGNWPGPTDDTRALQVTPVFTQDARPLPEVTISENRLQARPSTYRTADFQKDGRHGRPSLPTRTGRLGTLQITMIH